MKKNIEQREVVILGAGFDKNFGMPLWGEMLDHFYSFLQGNINHQRNERLAKIKSIFESGLSLERKYRMFKTVEEEHIKSSNEDLFEKTIFDLKNYEEKTPDILVDIVNSIQDRTLLDVITTNVSNVLSHAEMQPCFSAKDKNPSSYFPIHGLIFPGDHKSFGMSKAVLRDTDYIDSGYNERKLLLNNVLESVKKIHVFGYSMNDHEILKTIVNSNAQEIWIYYCYDQDVWSNILEQFYKDMAPQKNVIFVKQKINKSSDYEKLIKQLISNLKEVPKLSDFHKEVLEEWGVE